MSATRRDRLAAVRRSLVLVATLLAAAPRLPAQ